LGVSTISSVGVESIYMVEGDLSKKDVEVIAEELLIDRVTQTYSIYSSKKPYAPKESKEYHEIEVAYNTGVMDPVEHSTLKGILDLGISQVNSVRTAKKYLLVGTVNKKELDTIGTRVLSNKLIQHVVDHKKPQNSLAIKTEKLEFKIIITDLIKATSTQLKKISEEGQLFLNLNEMKTIQDHFCGLKRNPVDCELETIAQTWSEHCYHKTFRGNIDFTSTENGITKTKRIENLLKSTIAKATFELDKPWCVSVFHDNAGVIKFDKDDNICFKVETHNHPSALEPFGGANTGIGGVLRDILGTGLGAKPICNTDVFCFADPAMKLEDLPAGTLHPKRVMKGVVGGVRDYGNKMGIPTINGAILFDKHYVGNPLVYCGSVGIMPKDKVFKKVGKGDLCVVVGGRTGRDGIHGATFSSGELTTESEVVSSGAVQIGDPIQEKKVLDGLIKARDLNLYTAVTDCGAGGLSSAVGEMGEELGVRVNLEKVPLKYDGLKYMEIWISESQERMVFSVTPENIDAMIDTFASENVEATVIGEFTGNKKLEIFYDEHQVCDLSMEFLYEGNPKIAKKAKWAPKKHKTLTRKSPTDLTEKLFDCLGHLNVCSKEWVVRQYDHEVQGTSVVKPFVGVNCDGPSDAGVIAPKLGSNKGIAVTNGINARFGKIDPYWMALSCIDEAVRQIVSVGGNLERIAILDNFCWGNPDKPDRLGGMVRAAQGCYKGAIGYQAPFISGKDSLYNEYADGNKTIAIPGTLLISAVGIVENVTKCVTMDFKKADNLVYVIGNTYDELGGSIYLDTYNLLGNDVPKVNPKQAMKSFYALSSAIKKGYLRSSHDCSEGGLGVAVAEMAFAGGFGTTVHLNKVAYKSKDKRTDKVLFSESNSRLVVEVEPKNQKRFEELFKGIPLSLIGKVEDRPIVTIHGLDKDVCVNATLDELKDVWQAPLKW
ncbi:MAG: phosphoribosylformylglycinamidine synthase II, partial [Candidatus Omnitrophota bacterium]